MALSMGPGWNVDVRPESTWGQVFTTEGEIMTRKTGARNIVIVDSDTVTLSVDVMVKRLNEDHLGDVSLLAEGLGVSATSVYRILKKNEYRKVSRWIKAEPEEAPSEA